MYHIRCTIYYVPYIMYHILCTIYDVSYIMYHILCTIYYVPIRCIIYYVPIIMYHILCTIYYVPCIVCHILCTMYCVPYILYSVSYHTVIAELMPGRCNETWDLPTRRRNSPALKEIRSLPLFILLRNKFNSNLHLTPCPLTAPDSVNMLTWHKNNKKINHLTPAAWLLWIPWKCNLTKKKKWYRWGSRGGRSRPIGS